MIGIVDYGAGNLASVHNALEHAGCEAEICSDASRAEKFDRLILPGVGSFNAAMKTLDETGWAEALKSYAASGRPLLGICLGMQLLLDIGLENGPTNGLGLVPGRVVRLEPDPPLRVPHVGWNALVRIAKHPLFEGAKPQVDFYFVHSYHCVPDNEDDVLATCDFGGEFIAAVVRGNVAGMQFHPEKSQPAGMRILENFGEWEPEC